MNLNYLHKVDVQKMCKKLQLILHAMTPKYILFTSLKLTVNQKLIS